MGIGSHQSAAAGTTTWLTPQPIIDALGGWQSFDLDPCAAPRPQPWRTALEMNPEIIAEDEVCQRILQAEKEASK